MNDSIFTSSFTLNDKITPAVSAENPFPGFYESRIVVLDDEVVITDVVTKLLKDNGFKKIVAFNDPKEAVEDLIVNGVDVLVLDIRVANVNGLDILHWLRSEEKTQFVPVVVLTSATDETTRMQALTAGANLYVTKPFSNNELVQGVRNAIYFKQYANKIENQITSANREIYTDALTRLNSRRGFDENYPKFVSPDNYGKTGLILIDVDKFKETNDTYGHQAGDEVLRHFASIIQGSVKDCDYPARIGGDEFAIICNTSDAEWTEQLAELIRSRVSKSCVNFEGENIRYTISAGIANFDASIGSKGNLFKCADAALYQSKRQGRNASNVYSDAGALSIGHQHLTEMRDEGLQDSDPKTGTILIIDDEPSVTKMVGLQLKNAGFKKVLSENDANKAMHRIIEILPDVIILDIRMPGVNGLEILRLVRDNAVTANIPVLIMTSNNDEQIRLAALKLRANDFLLKPTSTAELETRVANSLKLKFQHDRLLDFSNRLKHEVEIRTNELFATRRETILCLARAAETRDTETGNHVIRVGSYAAIVAQKLGMNHDYVGWIELAAQLHDVGKLSIPDSILHKPGNLTPEERKIIETHCEQADRIFFGRSSRVEKATITSPLLKMASRIASTHHEKWDGSGYPNGLKGDQIPIEGRITAIADVFDALSTKRHYKDAFDAETCFKMIEQESGKHFDPKVVEAFLEGREDIMIAMEKWQDVFIDEASS